MLKRDEVFKSILTTGPHAATTAQIEAAQVIGLDWAAIFTLILQFVQYLPTLFALFQSLSTLLAKPGGITPADIQALVAQYSGPVEAMIQAILSALGIAIPTPVPITVPTPTPA